MANNVTYGIRLNGHEKIDIVLIPGDLEGYMPREISCVESKMVPRGHITLWAHILLVIVGFIQYAIVARV
jgi:hypothetical protein